MPISKEKKLLYPKNWKEIVAKIKTRANDKCEFCGVKNYEPNPSTGSKVVLTVAHLDNNPKNNADNNLKALCQKCHLRYDKIYHLENARKTREKRKGIIRLFND